MSERYVWSVCWLGIHAWSKWGDVRERKVKYVPLVDPNGWVCTMSDPTYTEVTQERKCVVCGMAQRRNV